MSAVLRTFRGLTLGAAITVLAMGSSGCLLAAVAAEGEPTEAPSTMRAPVEELTDAGAEGESVGARQTGFLPDASRMKAGGQHYPFKLAWVDANTDFAKYSELYVAPVSTQHLAVLTLAESVNLAAGEQEDAAEKVAAYVPDAFDRAIAHDRVKQVARVDAPSPRAIVVEMAIIELVPGRVAAGAAALAMPALRAPAAAIGSKVAGRGEIAMQTRLRDGATGEIVAMFEDERASKVALVNLTALTPYGFADEIVNDWAAEIIAVIEATPGEDIPAPSRFKLNPF